MLFLVGSLTRIFFVFIIFLYLNCPHYDACPFKQICDSEDSNISSIFDEAVEFIHHVEQTGGKVLVHCFEGRSRSATLVLAYLMLRK